MPPKSSQELKNIQRALTIEFISKHWLNVPAIWLKPESAAANAEDAVKTPEKLQTDLHDWNDDRNLGVRLVDGFLELQIKADEIWSKILFEACSHLRIDARAAYGPQNGPLNAILLKVDDPASIDRWADRWPRGGRDKAGQWLETKFVTSLMPTPRSKPIWRDSRPLPGSRFGGELIVWRPNGKPMADNAELGLEDFEPRSIVATQMESIVRAIAFSTLGYWIHVYKDGLVEWDDSLTMIVGGWLARAVMEGKSINARGQSLEGVCWSPVDDATSAGELVNFLISRAGAPRELGVAYLHANSALERNPLTPVPGWGAFETLFGAHAKVAIRRAFRAGLDIDVIERMADQYIFDASTHSYLDREAMLKGLAYEHQHDDLVRQYDNEPIFINDKPKNPFRLYSASSLRTDVQTREFFPGREPGGILRFSRVHGLLSNEQRQPDDYRLFNTFPGFAIKPIAVPDPIIMNSAISMLDKVLGYLTQDNDAQILWLKKFIAQIAQRPEVKPQVCPIIVGGQGIGKSVFGQDLMIGLFGEMAATGDAATLNDNKFMITPFLGRLITFIDEVRLESVAAINVIKKLVRSDYVSGQVKYGHQRDYYLPSRLLIASNSPDIGLSPADAADRAFFFILAWTAENKQMTEREFQEWAFSLKDFYNLFVSHLKNVIFRQHLMHYFMNIEVNREDLENLEHSSRNEETVVRATMPKAREIARQIVAEAHVIYNSEITAWFTTNDLRSAIKRVDGERTRVEASQVLMEYQRANVIEVMTGGYYKFKWTYGRLLQRFGEAHNLIIHPEWPTGPGDFEDNDVRSREGSSPWRGLKKEKLRRDYQSTQDDMEDF